MLVGNWFYLNYLGLLGGSTEQDRQSSLLLDDS